MQLLCTEWAKHVKGEEFKTIVKNEYVAPALKKHYLEVHIPEFAAKYHLTGSMSESGLELTHHNVNSARVCSSDWLEQQFYKNILRTSDILNIYQLFIFFNTNYMNLDSIYQ